MYIVAKCSTHLWGQKLVHLDLMLVQLHRLFTRLFKDGILYHSVAYHTLGDYIVTQVTQPNSYEYH